MDQLPATAVWRDAFVRVSSDLGTRIAEFLPSFVAAVSIIALGWLVSRCAEIAARWMLRTFGVDRAATRLGVSQVLTRAGVHVPLSQVVARGLFWLLMLFFLLFGVDTLGLTSVAATLDRLVGFVPALLGAGLILLFGLLLARFLGSVASSGAAAAQFPNPTRVGFFVRLLVAALVLVVAVEQLGVATSVLVGPLTVVLAATGLSAGLAFALGAYPIVTHILAGHFLKQSLPRNSLVEIGGDRGVVERVGAIDTLIRNGDESWSIPNAKLLDLTVKR